MREFFEGKRQYLMESFYRDMRKKYNILLENGKPMGGLEFRSPKPPAI